MNSLSEKNKLNYIKTAAASLLIVSAALLPILITYKGQLFYYGDYMTQQIPFIKECRRMMLSGTPFWSWNTFLGANFVGTYSFYIYGSPFFWPLLLIPEKYIGYGLSVMFIIKHITASVTAYAYLSTKTKKSHLAVIGALLYAFSGFTLDSVFYNHFLDVIALFPLIPLFTDKVLDNKRKWALSLAVFISSVTNYYFVIGTSVFFLIYLYFRVRYSDGKYNFKDALRCIIWYALGGLMSIFILLPSALCLLETNKAVNTFSKLLVSLAGTVPQVIKIIKGIVMPSEGVLGSASGFTYSAFNSNAAFLPVFGAVFLFSVIRKKNSTEWDYKLTKFLFIATLIPGFNGIFSMFSNLYYTRWWYAFVLISITASIHVIEEHEKQPAFASEEYRKNSKLIIILTAVTVLPTLLVKLLVQLIPDDFITEKIPSAKNYLNGNGIFEKFSEKDIRYILVFIFLGLLSYITLYVLVKNKSFYTKPAVSVVSVILVCALTYGVYMTNESYTYYKSNPRFIEENAYVQEDNITADSTEYSSRTSFITKKSDNSASDNSVKLDNFSMIANRPSIRTFNSFKSTPTSEFARIAGYTIGSAPKTDIHFTTPAIQCVLSVSDIADNSGNVTKAPYYVPMGYTYKYYVPDKGFEYTAKKDENNKRIQLMTKACILDDETAKKLKDVVIPLDDRNVDWVRAYEENLETACKDVVLKSDGFSAVSDGSEKRLVYFSVPHDSGWTAYVNGEETEIHTLNGGMMGIVVPEGRAKIEFKFVPPGLKTGIALSAVSALIFAGAIISDSIIRKKKEEI